jgi:hypothetical protein
MAWVIQMSDRDGFPEVLKQLKPIRDLPCLCRSLPRTPSAYSPARSRLTISTFGLIVDVI